MVTTLQCYMVTLVQRGLCCAPGARLILHVTMQLCNHATLAFVSRLQDQFVPVANDFPAIAVAVLTIPHGKGDRHRLADRELYIVSLLGFQAPQEDHAPGTVAPDAFAADILARGGLRF